MLYVICDWSCDTVKDLPPTHHIHLSWKLSLFLSTPGSWIRARGEARKWTLSTSGKWHLITQEFCPTLAERIWYTESVLCSTSCFEAASVSQSAVGLELNPRPSVQWGAKSIIETSGLHQGKSLFQRQPNEETGGQASNLHQIKSDLRRGKEQMFYSHRGWDYIHTSEKDGGNLWLFMRQDIACILNKHVYNVYSHVYFGVEI